MTYSEALIEWMKWKAEKIDTPSYFKKEDEEAIHEWMESTCRSILIQMKNCDSYDDGAYCPFCLKDTERCLGCEYAKTHARCSYVRSDYKTIIRALGMEITKKIGEPAINAKLKQLLEAVK